MCKVVFLDYDGVVNTPMRDADETTNWLTKGISEEQLKIEKALSVIAAQIFTKRTQMGMGRKAFAKFMGVSQRTVSRWESGTYNFSISTLIVICEKLELSAGEWFEKACKKEQNYEGTKNSN